jgi:hypothetical protein
VYREWSRAWRPLVSMAQYALPPTHYVTNITPHVLREHPEKRATGQFRD